MYWKHWFQWVSDWVLTLSLKSPVWAKWFLMLEDLLSYISFDAFLLGAPAYAGISHSCNVIPCRFCFETNPQKWGNSQVTIKANIFKPGSLQLMSYVKVTWVSAALCTCSSHWDPWVHFNIKGSNPAWLTHINSPIKCSGLHPLLSIRLLTCMM